MSPASLAALPEGALDAAVAALRRGSVVAVATESSFGLCADALEPRALDRLFSLKPRELGRGIGLIVADDAALDAVASAFEPRLRALARRFWPGPLSVVLPAASSLDPRLSVQGTIAVRIPGASPALDLVRRFGGALTATSANAPGEPPALTGGEVERSFADAVRRGILKVVDTQAPGGLPSTLVAEVDGDLRVRRPGAIDTASLERAWHAGAP